MLGILVGDARGAERERAEILADAMPQARLVGAAPPDADALLLAGSDPLDGEREPAVPVLAWLTADALAGRCPWPDADALLVPSSQAAREAMRRGFPRSAVHVVAHPVRGEARPAVRPAARPGCIGLLAPTGTWERLQPMLARLPAVSEVRPLPPVLANGRGDGAVDPRVDELSLAVVAAASTTGALPAALMERGIPIVTWDAGAAADLIVDGLCGWLVEPSVGALARRVQSVLAQRWTWESAGVAARDRVLARCSPAAVAAAVAAAVDAAAAGVSKRHPWVGHAGIASAS